MKRTSRITWLAAAAFLLTAVPATALSYDVPAPFVFVMDNGLYLIQPGETAPRRIKGDDWSSPASPSFIDAKGESVIFSAYGYRRFPPARGAINIELANIFITGPGGTINFSNRKELTLTPSATKGLGDIAFISNRHAAFRSLMPGSNTKEVFLIDPPLAIPERITRDGGTKYNPGISPDGSKIAYYWIGSDTQGLYVIDRNERVPIKLAQSGNFPTWSPDGRMIAYVNRGVIYRVRMQGDSFTFGKPSRILPESFKGFVSFTRWTGHGIVFQWSRGKTEGISLLEPKTGAIRTLTSGSGTYGGADLAESKNSKNVKAAPANPKPKSNPAP